MPAPAPAYVRSALRCAGTALLILPAGCVLGWPDGIHVLYPPQFDGTPAAARVRIACEHPDAIRTLERSRVLKPVPSGEPAQYSLQLDREDVVYHGAMCFWWTLLSNLLLPVGPLRAFAEYDVRVSQTWLLLEVGGTGRFTHRVEDRVAHLEAAWVDDNPLNHPLGHLIRLAQRKALARLMPALLEDLRVPGRDQVRLLTTTELRALRSGAGAPAAAERPSRGKR